MFFFKKKKKSGHKTETAEQLFDTAVADSVVPSSEETSVQQLETAEIEVKILPMDAIPDNRLVEVKNEGIVAKLNKEIMASGLARTGTALGKLGESRKGLYKVIIPRGKTLMNSSKVPGANVASYLNDSGSGIGGNAVLVPEKPNLVRVGALGLMEVASFAVGQYYLSQINNGIGVLQESVAALSEFQDNEFRGRIAARYNDVKTIVEHQDEILGSETIRKEVLHKLADYEDECAELLEQATLTLSGIVEKAVSDYSGYKNATQEVNKWTVYQSTLLQILRTVSDLRFTLSLGEQSNDLSYAKFNHYLEQSREVQKKLPEWHRKMTELLEINTEEKRRKRSGMDRLLYFVPSLFDKEKKYRSVDESIMQMIQAQSADLPLLSFPDETNLFETSVPLVIKEGKVYYYVEPGNGESGKNTTEK